MNHDDLIRHLTYFAELTIKDIGYTYGRQYLLGCIRVWREAYGDGVSGHMARIIRDKLNKYSATHAA